MITLYEKLEVSENASDEIIEKAYKTLAKKYHPDLQQTQEQKIKASEKMKEINEAYSILSDKEKKEKYDRNLEIEKQKELERQNNVNVKKETVQNIYNNESSNNYEKQSFNNYEKSDEDWRNQLNRLTAEERKNIVKKIEKDAKREYETMYRNYFRSLGYKVKNKISFKGVCTLILTVLVIGILSWILWSIPATKNYGIEIYNENIIVKIFIDIVVVVVKALILTLKSIF